MSDAVDSAAPPPPAEPGYGAGELVAGRFRLVRLLGEGGMGWVWVARDEQLDIDIAIKLIRNDVSVPAAAERLLIEARALARLEHAGIVHVVDFGRTEQNDPFIAMELLEGEDLGQILEREERLVPVKALQLLLPVAEALAAAHTRGIVHRDLKPDNVFLARIDKRIEPKVIDFGIAKLDLQTKHTQAGVALGSPDYMAPEQARGQRDVDHRADIWAFCIMIYETITGHVPFEDASYNAVLRHVIESPIPPIFEHGLDLPELWSILQRGFEKDREQRYQSMRELGAALAGWLIDHGVSEDVTGSSLRAVWFDAPRPSLLSIPEGRFSTGNVPGVTTSSSMAPPADAAAAPPPMGWRSKIALMGLGVFLAGVLAVLVVTHRRGTATAAPATRPQASQAAAVRAVEPDPPPEEPAALLPTTSATAAASAPAVSASESASAASSSLPAPSAPAATSRHHAVRWHPARRPPPRAVPPPAPKPSAPKPSDLKPIPGSEDLGF